MRNYQVGFVRAGDDGPKARTVKALSPGHAQQQFYRENPECKIIAVWTEARAGNAYLGEVRYEPVSPVKVEPVPVTKSEEQLFPFWNDCISHTPRT
jgi:hypothetical protein